MNTCKYCHNHTSPNRSGLTRHEKHCKENPNRVSQKPPWNKGLTLSEALVSGRISEKAFNAIVKGNKLGGKTSTGKAATTEKEMDRREKISRYAKQRGLGGYVHGSGRGKKGWYKGFFCDSSWELAYVVYCLDHSIAISRNTEKRKYIWKGVEKNYIPDFVVNDQLVEVKGYKTEQWIAKLEANPDVQVLYEKDLKPILEYVKNKYGKDFVNLYE
jgi:hypothetical protein